MDGRGGGDNAEHTGPAGNETCNCCFDDPASLFGCCFSLFTVSVSICRLVNHAMDDMVSCFYLFVQCNKDIHWCVQVHHCYVVVSICFLQK